MLLASELTHHGFFSDKTITSVTLLHGGLTHQVHRVDTHDASYITRSQPTMATHGVQPHQQQMTLQSKLADQGFSPNVFAFDHQLAIMEYIQGDHRSAQHWPIYTLQQFGCQLANVHHCKLALTLPQLDVVEQINHYRSLLSLPHKEQARVAEAVERLAELARYQTTMGLCHNDLNPRNIICTQTARWIIDWECAAMGNIEFDLASFIIEHQLDDIKSALFLQSYWNRVLEIKPLAQPTGGLYLQKIAYCLLCWLWYETHQLNPSKQQVFSHSWPINHQQILADLLMNKP